MGVLDYAYSEVISIHRNTLFTLVPMPLFDPDHLANYLKFNAKILGTDHLDYDPIQGLDSANVYVPFANTDDFYKVHPIEDQKNVPLSGQRSKTMKDIAKELDFIVVTTNE